MFAVEKGFLKGVEQNKILDFEASLHSYMNSEHADLMKTINESGNYNDEIAAKLDEALKKFKETQTW